MNETQQAMILRDRLHALYPHLSGPELDAAEENFRRYVAITARMYDRIRSDPQAYARFQALTGRGE